MSNKQETLIYVEKEAINEAQFMSRNFVDKEVKNRVYLNALGSELVMKYLSSEGIDVSNVYNLHSISKIVEDIDISDILLPNIHIDVRVVFDKKQIFIPKSHFEMEITPDIYVVVLPDEKFSCVELLGFFTPNQINKKDENAKYYFISDDKLSSPEGLSKYVKDFVGRANREITESDFLRGRELSVSLADHNLTNSEKIEFFELLLSSDSLRESVIEFDNFETLSYNTIGEMDVLLNNAAVPAELTSGISEQDLSDEDSSNIIQEDDSMDLLDEDSQDEDSQDDDSQGDDTESQDDAVETVSDDDFFEGFESFDMDDETLKDTDIEPLVSDAVSENEVTSEDIEKNEVIEASAEDLLESYMGDENDKSELKEVPDNLGFDVENLSDMNLDDLPVENFESGDEIKMDSADNLTSTPDSTKPYGEISSDDTVDSILSRTIEAIDSTAGAAAAGAAGAIAGAAAIEAGKDIAAAKVVSDGAMKLAGVAGDSVANVIASNIEKQQESLDRIDYSKNPVNATEIPEEVASLNYTVENHSDEYHAPKDLSELKPVETHELEAFEQETIDMSNMETVETESFTEDTDGIVNLSNLSNIDSPTKPVDNLNELTRHEEEPAMDLPDLSTFSIDDDNLLGGVGLDDYAMTETASATQDLVDLPSASDIVLDDSIMLDTGNLQEIPQDSVDVEDFTNIEEPELFSDSITPETVLQENFESVSSDDETSELENDLDLLSEHEDDSKQEETNHEDNDDTPELPEEELNQDVIEVDDLSMLVEDEPQEQELNLENDLNLLDSGTEDSVSVEDFENLSADSQELSLENDLNMLAQDEPQETSLEDDLNMLAQDEPQETSLEDDLNMLMQDDSQEINFDDDSELLSQNESPQENIEDSNTVQSLEEQGSLNEEFNTDLNAELESEIPDVETFDNVSETPVAAPVAMENSTVISDMNFKVGEIPIDINGAGNLISGVEEQDSLGNLYNENNNGGMLQTPGTMGRSSQAKGGNPVVGIVAILVILAIIGAIGFGVAKLFKAPQDSVPEPITDDIVPQSSDNGVTNTDTLNVNPDNVVKMDNNTDALAGTSSAVSDVSKPAVVPSAVKKPIAETAFIEVKKLTWEVPDYISYYPQFKQYFQSVGKSLKLSLTSDLLLATDYAYSNEVKVTTTFNKDGSFKDAKILKSSGSPQIDRIVLQTVNQTLKVLKAPASVGEDESTTAILKIYF